MFVVMALRASARDASNQPINIDFLCRSYVLSS